ncbi:CRISPR-associated endonuclease Cas1 1 [Deinococcus aerolatus]|uniref:CRISPR-associated endonuclease Cas1 n=1 Tax=Deinococcus aerolatus TaxID=522487 RepID=A0ABQ2G6S9_9DEIO|nr:CRISPR-associated endonuclease Cas1 [Deinococcus aerolatus]GGL77845.1 CRISPR-associated endonuclease Cas1 1 [Deinococcus aerolatus]
MTSVLVQTPGAAISARGGQLIVETGAGQHAVPLGHVTELIVIGNARISTAVIADLAGRGVPVHLQARAGTVPFSVLGNVEGQVEALRVQVLASPQARLVAARALVRAKVTNAGWVLRRLRVSGVLDAPAVEEAADENALRGMEGAAARQYFAALAGALPEWGFVGRAYRPAPDPVNAALSFAYMLLLGQARVAVARAGLHPGLGTLHVPHGRRPALALDVMEPFRGPVCDLTVASLLRSGRLKLDGFEAREGEVRLGAAGSAAVAGAVAQRMTEWSVVAALQKQVAAVQRTWAEGGGCACWVPPVRA